MKVSQGGGTLERFLIPEGLHPARCVIVAGIGEQEKTFQGETKMKNEVILAFEFPQQLHTFSPEDGEKPAWLSNIYTASLDERSNLYGHLCSWRGKKFTGDELKGFDLKKLLGQPCQILVKHVEKDGRTYVNIGDILKVTPKSVGAAVSDLIYYDPDSHDVAAFMALPEWIRNKVNRGTAQDAPEAEAPQSEDDDSDEIPF